MTTAKSKLPNIRVLHLDDDPFELDRVKQALLRHGTLCTFEVDSVDNVESYRQKLTAKPAPDVVILDIHLGTSVSGVDLSSETREALPSTVILLCSTADDIATITDGLNAGANDFISKHSDHGELSLRVFHSVRLARLTSGIEPIVAEASQAGQKLVYTGATLERIARRIPLIINSAISAVFIHGESGTGKEVVADLFGSLLKEGTPFLKVNCGAIAPTLLESELFGHVKGAFTGALQEKKGLMETCSGGWIMLDEVATLSMPAQVALLRVLENQEVLRVGATKPTRISLRILSATNEPMDELIKAGKFRGDLWQRLRETEISLPPLRERSAEIPALIEFFCQTMPGGPYRASKAVVEILSNVSWQQGNVRELRNVLRAMTELHVEKQLTPLAIPARIWDELGDFTPAAPGTPSDAPVKKSGRSSMLRSTPAVDLSSAAASGASPGGGSVISVAWPKEGAPNFDDLVDALLVAIVRRLVLSEGQRPSLRAIAQTIGMSRSTLSGRLKSSVHKNLITLQELSTLVGISEL